MEPLQERIRNAWATGKQMFINETFNNSEQLVDHMALQDHNPEIPSNFLIQHDTGDTIKGSTNDSATNTVPKTSTLLEQVILSHPDRDQLQQEVKELMMEWFWHGYYKSQSQMKHAKRTNSSNESNNNNN